MKKKGENPPNVLFILIDDLGWKDISCMGSEFYETPNIDGLVNDGIRFTRAYASCPVCSPTRASLLTGKYPARVGITQWIGGHFRGKVIGAPYLDHLPLKEKSLARAFKENGYSTYHIGKWHLGDKPYYPENHGFDVNIGGCHWGHPWHGYFSPYNHPNLVDGPKGEYLTDRLTSEAIKLLEKHIKTNATDKAKISPFFMYLSYYSVHTPIQVPEEEIPYFEQKKKMLKLDEVDEFKVEDIEYNLENIRLNKAYRRIVQSNPVYAAMVHRLDKNIGRVLEKIRELGLEENTIIVFYSDNGGLSDGKQAPTSNEPLRYGKSHLYEGGLRVPLLIKWNHHLIKGLPNNNFELPITTPDLYPTLLGLCGLPLIPEQHIDGIDFSPLLKSNADEHNRKQKRELEELIKNRPIFWHYPHYNGYASYPGSVVIQNHMKLIEWHEDNKIELFNIKEDVSEKINLISNDLTSIQSNLTLTEGNQSATNKYLKIRQNLYSELNKWKEEVKAIMPKPNPNYPFYLAENYIYSKGELVIDEDNNLCIKTYISKGNPNLYDIPLSEYLEEFLEKTIKLKIGDADTQCNNNVEESLNIKIGQLIEESGQKNGVNAVSDGEDLVELFFYDSHEENKVNLKDLLNKFIGSEIEIRAWDGIPENLKERIDSSYPQVEINQIRTQ